MKAVISVASVLACAFLLDAQITATLKTSPDGSNEIRIRNDAAVSLPAFAIVAHRKMDDLVSRALAGRPSDILAKFYFDSAMDTAVRPLLPNEERTVAESSVLLVQGPPAGKHFIVFEKPSVTAGIFAGGATTGDAALLTLLMMRRSNMLLAVDTALETLSGAGRRNVPPGWLIEQFRRMALSRFYLLPEQQVGRDLYQSILGKLINLPDQPLGSPFPPTAFVEQETAMLRQRRATLVESRPSLEDAARIGR